jgi:hypothetical protein
MNNGFELAVAEQTLHPFFICEIEREKPETGPYAELPKPRILESGIIIIVKVVHTDNLKAILEEPADDMRANETSGARHQNALFSYSFHHYFFLTYCGRLTSRVLHRLIRYLPETIFCGCVISKRPVR